MSGAAVESFRNNMMRTIGQQMRAANIEGNDAAPTIEGL